MTTWELRAGLPCEMTAGAARAMSALAGLTTPVRYIERLEHGWEVTLVTFVNPSEPPHRLTMQYTDEYISAIARTLGLPLWPT